MNADADASGTTHSYVTMSESRQLVQHFLGALAYRHRRRPNQGVASHSHRAHSSFGTFSGFVGLVALSAGCFVRPSASVVFEGCGSDDATRGYVLGTAANAVIGDHGSGGDRIRSLADVPLRVDSIRARSRVVSDYSVCERLWHSLDPEDRQARVIAVQIGRTYWIRVPGGTQAFDDRGKRLTAIVDLDH